MATDNILVLVIMTVAVPTILVGGVPASWNAEQVMLFTPGSSSPSDMIRVEMNMTSPVLVTGSP